MPSTLSNAENRTVVRRYSAGGMSACSTSTKKLRALQVLVVEQVVGGVDGPTGHPSGLASW